MLAWVACSAVAYVYAGAIMHFLAAPLADAFTSPGGKRLIFTGLPEAFLANVKIAMFAGIFAAFPVIAAQLYRFIAPGLYHHERRAVLPFVIAAPMLFYAGAALAYYYIFPAAWKFFVAFEMPSAPDASGGLPVELEARLSEYLGLVTSVVLAFGLAFQLPLALLLLVRAGLVSAQSLKRGRRYAIVALLIAAAVLTPPDIISQVGLFAALYVLYEAALWAAVLMERRDEHTPPSD